MLLILKIPIVYMCAVVWWAIKAEPRPLEGAGRPRARSILQPRLRLAPAATRVPLRPLRRAAGRARIARGARPSEA